jgi:hypothetical protein
MRTDVIGVYVIVAWVTTCLLCYDAVVVFSCVTRPPRPLVGVCDSMPVFGVMWWSYHV